jgi:hypothetical protein
MLEEYVAFSPLKSPVGFGQSGGDFSQVYQGVSGTHLATSSAFAVEEGWKDFFPGNKWVRGLR